MLEGGQLFFEVGAMVLPMFAFVLTLIVVGGLASLVAAGDRHARWAPFIGFVFLFAGLGALFLSLGLVWLLGVIFRSRGGDGLGFLGGYAAGGLGGALLGLKHAFLRRRRFREMADE